MADGESLGRVVGFKHREEFFWTLENSRHFRIFQSRADSSKIARYHDEVVALLAGGEAERLFVPSRAIRSGMHGDLKQAYELLCRLYADEELRTVFKWLQIRARNLVARSTHHRMIQDLAHALIKKRQMNAKEVASVFRASFDKHTAPAL
jgi:hypothetical protein